MKPLPAGGLHGLTAWLAAGILASVCALVWFGHQGIREWQRSSTQLVERRAKEAVDLLVTAFVHDMRGVQRTVLASTDRDVLGLDPPYDLNKIVASAFARYPYPDVFFTTHPGLNAEQMVFFTRSDRPPVWAEDDESPSRFPVTMLTRPDVAGRLFEHIGSQAEIGRRYSMFEVTLGGQRHQVVARLFYRDPFRDSLDGVFGFMVNLAWVRDYYVPEMTAQVARIAGTESGLSPSIVDARGRLVVGTAAPPNGPFSRRSFPLMFFDPLLVAVDQPSELSPEEWTVTVSGAGDPTLVSAIRGANRTVGLAALAAFSLALGLALTARAVRSNASLAELRSEFVSTVTHELKTPIATIRAVGDSLVSGRVAAPEAQRGYAQMVVQEAKRLTLLVDNLLAMSRITDATEVYSFEPLPADSVIETSLRTFTQQLGDAGFAVEVRLAPDLPPIRGDRTALTLLFDNLVDNAIRYSPHEKQLTIDARREGSHVSVGVADRGTGIPPEEIGQVTRKFFRGRNVQPNGSGLGLAIVSRIVNDHGGRLAIESEVGQGTTVTVTLPAWQDHEETSSRR